MNGFQDVRSIFMTGGAGFLGRHLMRWMQWHYPDVRFTVFSRDEGKHAVARHEFPQHSYIIGDVRDPDRVELAMSGHDAVIHTAALKYVPQCEQFPSEAVATNVDGSRNVAIAAIRNRVKRVIGISTDKACRPENVYGMTKRMMERLFQEADTWSDTQFNLVRYGNVIASTGSVIPIFMEQAREGVLFITNPQMTRFWLTATDAVEMIVEAMSLPIEQRGTIKINRLPATDLITVAYAAAEIETGKSRDELEGDLDFTMKIVGDRSGEKVHEDLLSPAEAQQTEHYGHEMFLYPPGRPVNPSFQAKMYTSNTPDHWIRADEMKDAIMRAIEHE